MMRPGPLVRELAAYRFPAEVSRRYPRFDAAAARAVLGGNAARLYRIPVEPVGRRHRRRGRLTQHVALESTSVRRIPARIWPVAPHRTADRAADRAPSRRGERQARAVGAPGVGPAHGAARHDPDALVLRALVGVEDGEQGGRVADRHDDTRRRARSVGQPRGVAAAGVEHAARDRRRSRRPRRVRRGPAPGHLPRLQEAVGEQRGGPLVGVRVRRRRVRRRGRRRRGVAGQRPRDVLRHLDAPHRRRRRPGAGGGSRRGRCRPRAARSVPRRRRRRTTEPVAQAGEPEPLVAALAPVEHRDLVGRGEPDRVVLDHAGCAASTAGRAPSGPAARPPRPPRRPSYGLRSTTTGSAQPQRPPQPGDLRRAAVGAVGEHRQPAASGAAPWLAQPGVQRNPSTAPPRMPARPRPRPRTTTGGTAPG